MQITVVSEVDGIRLFEELKHDCVVPNNASPIFDNKTSYSLDENGEVVMSTDIVTIMSIKELPIEKKCRRVR